MVKGWLRDRVADIACLSGRAESSSSLHMQRGKALTSGADLGREVVMNPQVRANARRRECERSWLVRR